MMRKNAWTPLIAILVICAVLPLVIHRAQGGGGAGGPELFPGISRGREQAKVQAYGPAELSMSLQVEEPSLLAPSELAQDFRRGVEVVPWNGIALVADDRSALTRAVIKGLEEHLTGALQAGAPYHLVYLVPAGAQGIPLPATRIVRVSTQGAEATPEAPGTALQFRVEAALIDPTRGVSRAAQGVREFRAAWSIQVAPGPRDSWSRWYATIGRRVAGEILAQAADRTEMDFSVLDHGQLHGIWGEASGGLGAAIPDAPQHQVVRWLAAWQQPLRRGWYGLITGTAWTNHKTGRREATHQALMDLLIGRGGWQQVPTNDDSILLHPPEGHAWQGLRLRPLPGGWAVSLWADRPDASSLVQSWLTQAHQDPAARALLRRHAQDPVLEAALRRHVQQYLLADPTDLATVALLGLEPLVPEALRAQAQALAWVRGLGAAFPAHVPADLPALDRASPTPRLGSVGQGLGVVLPSAQGVQIWSRQPNGRTLIEHIGEPLPSGSP